MLHGLSGLWGLPFLPFYTCTGLWASAVLLLLSLFSISNVYRQFSRFTTETFMTVVATYFLLEAAGRLGACFFDRCLRARHVGTPRPVNAHAAASPAHILSSQEPSDKSTSTYGMHVT